MKTIQTRPDRGPGNWPLSLLIAVVFFALGALSRNDDPFSDEVRTAQAVRDLEEERQQDLALLADMGRTVREAHAQGMREAIAGMSGTPDREVLQRTCSRLWGMEQVQ